MRLIDADKLKLTTGFFTYRDKDDTDTISTCAYTFVDVFNAETINAIPIDFIEHEIDNYPHFDWQDDFEYYYGDALKHILLKRWEQKKETWGKENDRPRKM